MNHDPAPGLRSSFTGALAGLCCRRARAVALIGLALGLAAIAFSVSRFSMNTDTGALIASSLRWRRQEARFNALFRPEGSQIVAVVDGATPELAEAGAARLSAALAARPDLFHDVERPDGGPFFAREGLLYEPPARLDADLDALSRAQPFLGAMAADPSLRGVATTLSTAATGVAGGAASLADLAGPFDRLSQALEAASAGRPAFFSWRALVGGESDRRETRRIVLASPQLDYHSLTPGAAASAFVRRAAARLGLTPADGVTVRLTGDAPLADEELASLSKGAGLIAALALAAIIAMLWLAVRSWRLIWSILLTMLIGLSCAAALGLMIFGRFNVISVAFIPLFVGLGIDFGIQYSVRWLACRSEASSTHAALITAGSTMGRSLSLAATAIAVGFFAFIPTRYVGVSQLGVIAGLGMFIALALNLTVLPAFIALTEPPVRGPLLPGASLESLDRFLLFHRWPVVGVACVVAAAALGLAVGRLHFDFNPLHLKDPRTQSVSTLVDLARDPAFSPTTAEVVAPDLARADALAARLGRLPAVEEARTLSDFVPADQPAKLAAIGATASLLDLTLNPIAVAPPPTDAETRAALTQASGDLVQAAAAGGPGAPAARRLADDLARLAKAPPVALTRADAMLVDPYRTLMGQIRDSLAARPVSLATLPAEIRRDWLAPDGEARVSVVPAGDSNDNAVLRRFIAQVRSVAPQATGAAVATFEGGRTVAWAFAEAGALSFVAITALLLIVLRRVRDVAITLAPIILTGLLTLGSCVVIGQPLNFANIIALPLLFGIGVAFHIYFVLAWRAGGGHLIASSLTRAVFFSALATATGFGSLWASSHPGTASMGKLLMISLVWTLASALLFQPALMGPPRAAARKPG